MTALEMARSEEQPQPPLAATPPLELQRHVDVLAAQSAQLESEATQLQETLMTHQHFVAIVYSASTASEPSSDDDDDMEADDVHIVEQPWRSQTDDDVVSPDHHHHTRSKFYHSPHARGVNDATRQHESVAAASWPALGFQPLSLDQARVFVGETYHGILRFALSGRAVSSGARVMGWEDRRLVDGDTTVKFSLRKQFVGESADALMAETWQCFSDPECADKKFRGLMTVRSFVGSVADSLSRWLWLLTDNRTISGLDALVQLQILQHVNDDTIVALRDSLSPDGTTVFRCVYLLFRVRTRSGFIICSRSIDRLCVSESARTAAVPGGRAVQWVELFGWFVFDQLGYADPSAAELFHETGAQVEYGGSVDFGDASVLEAVVMDTLATVTRWESFMVTPSFRLPASAAA